MIRGCYIAQSILPENVKLFILSANILEISQNISTKPQPGDAYKGDAYK